MAINIDIIQIETEEMGAISTGAQMIIREAQRKKEAILKRAADEIASLKYRLTRQGTVRSSILETREADIRADADAEIEAISEQLIFDLEHGNYPSDTKNRCPYELDEALTRKERHDVVYAYYMAEYPNRQTRVTAALMDTYARDYLGSYYYPLLITEVSERITEE